MRVLAILGPTAVGKTDVAIAVAEALRERGEHPVAVSCDALQVYAGLEALTGAPSDEQRGRLEHRLVGIVGPGEEFSVGRFAELARGEIDALLAAGRRPIVVGGTGLYMRAALAELDLRPRVASELRDAVEAELAERGPEALREELDPEVAASIHPHDRKRIARAVELQRAGVDPPQRDGRLWAAPLRHPTEQIGITVDRDELRRRIDARVEQQLAGGAAEQASRADAAGASRTARAAIGFEELLAGDPEAMRTAQRRFARRQLTWMRRMPGLRLLDRTGRDDDAVAAEIVAVLQGEGAQEGRHAPGAGAGPASY